MKHFFCLAVCAASLAAACSVAPESSKMIRPVDFTDVSINDGFWSAQLKKHKEAVLPACIAQIEDSTGRMQNFINASAREGQHSGIFFDDSDVYKALEGIAYSLAVNPDPVLEAKADEWIGHIAGAQLEDGYINTYYTLTGLDRRWTDMDRHEMYCAGHLIEAGVAYYKATGKRTLLDVGQRMADHMMTVFGPGRRHWVPGHEEIELALVKLYETTGRKEYLDFAYWLLEERGHGYGSKGPDGGVWSTEYYQDAVPVKELADISGHAVRCMYLYCGMADVAALVPGTGYVDALHRLWDDVVLRNMYITGGIGSSAHNEGFTEDYDLPNLEAYCETCASVGMVLWNHRMNQFTGDSKYADVMERAMYNGVISGVSLKGDTFFYVNPLESEGTHHRQRWYGTACCPSQISRFLPSVGNYVYGVSDDAVWVNLFIGGAAEFATEGGGKPVRITQETDYPWDGKVTITVEDGRNTGKELRIRIPGWCREWTMTVNGSAATPQLEKGYAVIPQWTSGDRIVLDMEMPVETVSADPRVLQNTGKRAVRRGPLVYCAEEADNPDFSALSLSSDTEFSVEQAPGMLGGIDVIRATDSGHEMTFIPYFLWDNRAPGRMLVWLPYQSPQDPGSR